MDSIFLRSCEFCESQSAVIRILHQIWVDNAWFDIYDLKKYSATSKKEKACVGKIKRKCTKHWKKNHKGCGNKQEGKAEIFIIWIHWYKCVLLLFEGSESVVSRVLHQKLNAKTVIPSAWLDCKYAYFLQLLWSGRENLMHFFYIFIKFKISHNVLKKKI